MYEISAIIGANYRNVKEKNFTLNDLVAYAVEMPKEATNNIDFSCGDIYQVGMPANFSIYAVNPQE